MLGARNAEKDSAEKVGGRALNRAKEALMNKMTKLFMLDGVGYGSAYVKKVGDWEVTVE